MPLIKKIKYSLVFYRSQNFCKKLLCRHKTQICWMEIIFWCGTKCISIFGLFQKIWTSPKYFGTLRRTRHMYTHLYGRRHDRITRAQSWISTPKNAVTVIAIVSFRFRQQISKPYVTSVKFFLHLIGSRRISSISVMPEPGGQGDHWPPNIWQLS